MTLDQWLQEATGSFPAGVQARLAQEYRAHLEESVAAGGSGDPVVLFGRPKKVRQQLKRTYLNIEGWHMVSRANMFLFWLVPVQLVVFNFFGWQAASLRVSSLLVSAFPCVIWGVSCFVSRSWPKLRQIYFRQSMSMIAIYLFIYLVSWGTLEHLIWLKMLAVFGLPYLVLNSLSVDARLRRTLALEGQA